MRRRRVLAFFVGAALSPVLAGAQPPDRMRRIGVLTTFGEDDPLAQRWLGAFRKGLEEAGWRVSRNLQIDYRWAGGDTARLRGLARELVKGQPDVLLGVTTPAVAALLKETHTIPIVFAEVSDPIGSGFVARLSRPGGNVTGFTDINIEASLGGKWVELIKEVSPAIQHVGMIYNPAAAPFAAYFLKPFEAAGPVLAVETTPMPVNSAADLERAVAALASRPGGAMVALPDVFNIIHREQLVALAARYRLPAIYPYYLFAEIGGLLSYGVDSQDLFRQAASYVDRVLKGAKPADLPVQAPTKFVLAINMKAVAALGLTIPQTIFARADEVIE